jgi:RsiW-degrading membrane proteinase PrsW (M82 family)
VLRRHGPQPRYAGPMSGPGPIGGEAFASGPWAPPEAAPPELLRRPRRRGNVVFTIVVSVAMLVGAAVMCLVLVLLDAPDAVAVGALLAALPVGPLLACFAWLDRYEPEPVPLLLTAFGWGALVATAAALILQLLDRSILGTPDTVTGTIVAPITEEGAKGLFIVLLLVSRRRVIDGVLDGIVYAGFVGVGFAFTENILYLGSAYMGGGDNGPGGIGSATTLFVVRGIFSPFAHPLFTSLTGIGIGVAVVTRSRVWRVLAPLLGYVAAVTAHGSWNGSATFGGGLFLLTYVFAMVPAFLLLAGFALWARSREGRMLTRSLVDLSQRGLIDPAEVPWLVKLPARRASRRFARGYGGPTGERVMREYQQQAVELGFLHDRYLRGTAPHDTAQRGGQMVQRLRALRPYVGFPTGAQIAGPGTGPGWSGPGRSPSRQQQWGTRR